MCVRAAVRSSLTTGSIQSLYIAPMRPKCRRKLNAAMIVRFQSIWLATPPLTDSGSCGRGCTGGGATNWKRNVVSPMTTLPRASSVSRIWYAGPTRFACPLRATRSVMPVASATRPVIPSRKLR